MAEKYEDLELEELVAAGELILIGEMMCKFVIALERAGFQYHSELDAIAVFSMGCTAMRLAGFTDEQISKSLQASLENTRKDYDSTSN